MSSLAVVIPLVVVAWIGGLALVVALCVTSARSDRDTRLALRQASRDGASRDRASRDRERSGGSRPKLVIQRRASA